MIVAILMIFVFASNYYVHLESDTSDSEDLESEMISFIESDDEWRQTLLVDD